MPPTLAAARNTTLGALLANQSNTAAWSRRSRSRRPAVSSSTSSCARRRTSALPTMPRWPATKTVFPFSSNGRLAIGDLALGDLQIARHHFLYELGKARLRLPAELLARLAGVADQQIDLRWTEIDRVDAHQGLARLPVDAGFLDPLAAPLDGTTDLRKRKLDQLAHRPGLAGRHHK